MRKEDLRYLKSLSEAMRSKTGARSKSVKKDWIALLGFSPIFNSKEDIKKADVTALYTKARKLGKINGG